MLDATVIQGTLHHFVVKIIDEEIMHDFTIQDDKVEYLVRKSCGEPVARSTAEIINKDEEPNGHLRGLTIRTAIYDFEVRQEESYAFHAYQSKRR